VVCFFSPPYTVLAAQVPVEITGGPRWLNKRHMVQLTHYLGQLFFFLQNRHVSSKYCQLHLISILFRDGCTKACGPMRSLLIIRCDNETGLCAQNMLTILG